MRGSSMRILAISTLLASASALPFDQPHGRSRFAIVNVDGSSEPSNTPPPAPAVTDTVTKTVADAITIPAYAPQSPTRTITVTFESSISSRALNLSKTSVASTSSSILSYTRNSTIPTSSRFSSSLSLVPSSSPAPPPPSTPCTSTTPITSSSSAAPSPTKQADCDDDDDHHHAPPNDGAPWRPKATFSTLVTSVAKPSYSYPASARAALPSGMTAPLPVLPTEAPVWVNKTQVPHYRKRDVVLDDFVEVLV